jgi:hypothetical protein
MSVEDYHMSEFELSPETSEQKAMRWMDDVSANLQARAEDGDFDESSVRFLERIERGSVISERRIEVLASLQDSREAFFIEHGSDPLMEQFLAFRLSLEK